MLDFKSERLISTVSPHSLLALSSPTASAQIPTSTASTPSPAGTHGSTPMPVDSARSHCAPIWLTSGRSHTAPGTPCPRRPISSHKSVRTPHSRRSENSGISTSRVWAKPPDSRRSTSGEPSNRPPNSRSATSDHPPTNLPNWRSSSGSHASSSGASPLLRIGSEEAVEWVRYGRPVGSDSRRSHYLAVAVGMWLGCVLIAGGTYVLASIPSAPTTTPSIAAAARTLQSTHSRRSPSPQSADEASASTGGRPSSVLTQDIVAQEYPATAAATLPTELATKRTSGVQTGIEPPRQEEEEAPTTSAERNTPLAISATSAFSELAGKPDAPAPAAQLSDADRAFFAQRGNELVAAGDISSARLFFERAADAGDVRSALGMAMTFDPAELAKGGVRGLKGDQAQADYWYQRARSLAGGQNFENKAKGNRRD
jgi:hypothetical protein